MTQVIGQVMPYSGNGNDRESWEQLGEYTIIRNELNSFRKQKERTASVSLSIFGLNTCTTGGIGGRLPGLAGIRRFAI
jgi:hypothetical protein